MSLRSNRIKIEDSIDAIDQVYELACQRGWTDGLPVIPPTPDRVEKMLAYVAGDPNEVLAEIPPKRGRATLEKVAINAVMAGCLPSYMPVIIAIIEAMMDPNFNFNSIQTTTNPVAVLTIVNGPIRQKLGINCSYGCLGPGWRANATIGRAVRLIQLNIGGAIPGEVSKSTHGQPGRYAMCFGELEERNPWGPLHVERGFKVEESTVTVMAPSGTTNIIDPDSVTAEGVLTTIAHSMEAISSLNITYFGVGEMLVILNPDHAALMARGGFTREEVKRFLLENTKDIPLAKWPKEKQDNLIKSGRVVNGMVPLAARHDQFVIVVAGGDGGYHSVFMPTFGDFRTITKLIREKS